VGLAEREGISGRRCQVTPFLAKQAFNKNNCHPVIAVIFGTPAPENIQTDRIFFCKKLTFLMGNILLSLIILPGPGDTGKGGGKREGSKCKDGAIFPVASHLTSPNCPCNARPLRYARPLSYARPPSYARPLSYSRPPSYARPLSYARPPSYARPLKYAHPPTFLSFLIVLYAP
jgi:hypothetical protein